MISGKVEFQLIGATLSRDVKLFGRMNPYVVISVGDVKKTGAVNSKGGKNPKWCDKLQFHRTNEATASIQVYHMRKFGFLDNVIVGTGSFDLSNLNQAGTNEVLIPISFEKQPAGSLLMTVQFLPDVQVGFQQGELVQVGEAPLDMTLRVVSALLTRDTQWFGQMSCYFSINCGDKKHRSNVCEKSGKNPRWTDQFKIVKLQDMPLTIDIQNNNNNTSLGHCTIPHNLLSNCLPGVRTVQLFFEKEPAGQLFLEVIYNSLPQNAPVAQLPPPSQLNNSNNFNQQQQQPMQISNALPNTYFSQPAPMQNNLIISQENQFNPNYPPQSVAVSTNNNMNQQQYPFGGTKNTKFAANTMEQQATLNLSQQQQLANQSNLQFQQISQAQNMQQQQIYQQKVQQQQFKAAPFVQQQQQQQWQQPYQQNPQFNQPYQQQQYQQPYGNNNIPAPQYGVQQQQQQQYQPGSAADPYNGYYAPPPPPAY